MMDVIGGIFWFIGAFLSIFAFIAIILLILILVILSSGIALIPCVCMIVGAYLVSKA